LTVRMITLPLLLCPVLLFPACGGRPEPAPAPKAAAIPTFLPASGELAGWQPEDAPQVFRGEALWEHINGGAEIYHEYGFEQATVQEYANGTGKSVVVEVFEMTDPASAFGIYSFKIGRAGEELGLTNGGRLESYYLNFWKGKFAVTITGFEEDPDTLQALKSLARLVDGRIESAGDPPALVRMLPESGLDRQTVKYFKGSQGLFNSYAFDTADIFRFQEAVRGVYEEGYEIYILQYASEEDCRLRAAESLAMLGKSGRFKEFRSGPEAHFMRDSAGKLTVFRSRNRHTCIIVGAPSPERALRIGI